jgi:hypothetical protein
MVRARAFRAPPAKKQPAKKPAAKKALAKKLVAKKGPGKKALAGKAHAAKKKPAAVAFKATGGRESFAPATYPSAVHKDRDRAAIGGIIVARMFFDSNGLVRVDELSSALRLTQAQLAETAGLPREALQKSVRRESLKAQVRLRELMEIVDLVQGWAGGSAQALAWYRAEPIPAFGGRTAEALVKSGQASAVRDYIDHIAIGGYA